MVRSRKIYLRIRDYYTERILKYGPTPLGVDWLNTCQQEARFEQLLKICRSSSKFSVNDLGCGYGALFGYLRKCRPSAEVDYLGIDLSATMIREARRIWAERSSVAFVVGNSNPRTADYSIASGIFN